MIIFLIKQYKNLIKLYFVKSQTCKLVTNIIYNIPTYINYFRKCTYITVWMWYRNTARSNTLTRLLASLVLVSEKVVPHVVCD
jgi:hypothetical protein